MDIEDEKNRISNAVECSRLMADFMQKQDKENKRLWAALTVCAAVIVSLLFGMHYQNLHMEQAFSEAIAQSQETFNQAMIEALNTVAEMEVTSDTITTTTTQTAEGDSATFNNVTGDQYNDSAQNVGGGE